MFPYCVENCLLKGSVVHFDSFITNSNCFLNEHILWPYEGVGSMRGVYYFSKFKVLRTLGYQHIRRIHSSNIMVERSFLSPLFRSLIIFKLYFFLNFFFNF